MTNLKYLSLSLVTAGSLLASGFTLAATQTAPAQTTMAAATPDSAKEMGPMEKKFAELNLTDAQKADMKKIKEKYQPEFAKLREDSQKNKQELDMLHGANYDKSKVQTLAKAEGDNLSTRIQKGGEMRNEFFALLTPEQKAKVKTWSEQRIANKAAKRAEKAAK